MSKKDRIPLSEQETNISIEVSSNKARVFSSIPHVMKRIYKLLAEHPKDVELDIDDPHGISVYVPKTWIRIKPPIVRQYTDEQKQALLARFKQNKN